jgi:hypothetical protein
VSLDDDRGSCAAIDEWNLGVDEKKRCILYYRYIPDWHQC